ncbi:CapA family protein [Bacillus sp. 2205SS5-2]|uniref:CapA family protein n=1 Tax=Bacillus sp. 2205SS5-2 TaxID=3109031 RepID=UPI0030057A92
MKRKLRIIPILFALFFLFTIGLLMKGQLDDYSSAPDTRTASSLGLRVHQLVEKPFSTNATIGAIGDILIHDRVYDGAKTSSGYDFRPMLENVKEHLQKPDFLIANQESMPGGVELGLSSYPSFNSPHEIIDALQDAGVDMVTNANNHSLDRGEKALNSAIDYYEKVNMPYTGAFKSPEDQQTIRKFNVNGISFAVLSYTYGTNGIPVPAGKDYMVNLIDEQKMIQDIQRVKKEAEVDLVILGIHWGLEYQLLPTDFQQNLAHSLTDVGADIIFGHHPHVLQPIETRKTADGRDAVIVYSLGNFISGQTGDYKDIGGILSLTVEKNITQEGTTITYPDIEFQSTFVAKDPTYFYKMYSLDQAKQLGLTYHTVAEINTHMSKYMNMALR